mmetsp:Transcript_4064/g.6878  ORF Transcript_4064/g.6878 Transcript_4064/m.6878 type:complete len:154 (-) Transcript_4064:154-615(-)
MSSTNLDNLLNRDRSIEKLIQIDNPKQSHLFEINRYIKALDQRLSVPKFQPAKEASLDPHLATSPRAFNKMRKISLQNSRRESILNMSSKQSPRTKREQLLEEAARGDDYDPRFNQTQKINQSIQGVNLSRYVRGGQRDSKQSIQSVRRSNGF